MLLRNRVIVFLGNTRFDSEIRATSLFIARNLAKYNKVFFIDYPYTFKDYLNYNKQEDDQNRYGQFAWKSDGLLDTDIDNLKIVITPPVLPINFLPEGFLYRSALKINESIIATRLKKIFKAEGVKEFIYINSFNFHYPKIADLIKPMLTIYHCVDPMIVPYDMKHGIISEDMLVKDSDLVICTSKALYVQKVQQNKHTYFVPNATDSTLQYNTDSLERPKHPQVKDLKTPIVGYLGTIERRIDYALLEEIVDINPQFSFVLAGPVSDNFVPDSLSERKNVYITGAVPYEEVPQMINSFDITIIPFKKDAVSETIFPIKLFEYLSAGKAVIATDFNPDLREFTEECVTYCSDAKSFSQAIHQNLANNDETKIQERKDLARKNTWEHRSDQIAEIIQKHLPA